MIVLVGTARGAGKKIDERNLQVGESYRVDSLTSLMPEMKKADPMATISNVRYIPPGGAFKVDAVELKYRDMWYKVRAIDAKRQVIGAGYIHSSELAEQKLTTYGVKAVSASSATVPTVPVVEAVADGVDGKAYKIVSSDALDYALASTQKKIKRKLFRIQLLKKMTDAELKQISEDIVKETYGMDAIAVLYYLPDTDLSGPFTAGKATWAPDGRWEDAAKPVAKKFVVEYGSVDDCLDATSVVDLPAEAKQAIYTKLIRSSEVEGKDETQTRAGLARENGITVQQVKQIKTEGIYKNWPMR